MRDLALVAVIGPLLLWSLKRPEIGAYLWAWLSVMNPHKLAFGFAHNFPFAQAAAGVTLFAFLVTKGRKPFPGSTLTTIYLCFLVWMCVTTVFAIGDPMLMEHYGYESRFGEHTAQNILSRALEFAGIQPVTPTLQR